MATTESNDATLAASRLAQDPRIQQAKELLQAAVAEAAAEITDVRSADPSRRSSYKKALERLAASRGGAPYFPYISSGLGNGPFIQLADGSVKLDFIVGIGVHGLGHSHPANIAASVDAAIEDTIMQGNLQHDSVSLAMMERLLTLADPSTSELAHVLLSTSGAMANENALKIAMHAKTPANRVICIDNCFAGRSIALASLTDRPAYRAGLPLALDVDYLPMFHPRDPAGTTEEAVNKLQKLLARHPGRYACIWLELVAGEGGYYPGTTDYFTRLCQICRQHDVTIIFDEVQTFGRLSQPFAFQHFGLQKFADIVTIGKITQLCATLFRANYKPKAPILSQTFTAATSSIHAGLAALDMLEEKDCFGESGWNVRRHRHWVNRMEEIRQRHPNKISGPYGEGMMFAFTPADGRYETANDLTMRLFEAGLMGFMAGSDPTRLRFLPSPAIVTESHIDRACEIIEDVLANYAGAS